MSGFPPPPQTTATPNRFPPPPPAPGAAGGAGRFPAPPPPAASIPAHSNAGGTIHHPQTMQQQSHPSGSTTPAAGMGQITSAVSGMSITQQHATPSPPQQQYRQQAPIAAPRPQMPTSNLFRPAPAFGHMTHAPAPPAPPQPPIPQLGGQTMPQQQQQQPQPPAAPKMFSPAAPPGGGPQIFRPVPPSISGGPPPPGASAGVVAATTPAASPFYQQTPSQAQVDRMAGAMASAGPAGLGITGLMPAPSVGPVPAPGGIPQPPSTVMDNENIDYSVIIPERLCRFTTGKLPQTAMQASNAKLPCGAVLRPLAPDGTNDEPIETIQPGSAGIVRCKRCRTYINAFVTWTEHGRRWRCNICGQMNDCPSAYFCHLDELGLRRDRMDRPELSRAVVEFIAPAEYMVRPPQEPTYFFVFDVSATAVRSGMLRSAASAIKACLDDLPGRNRTKIGFITFDNAVHYYNLAPDLANPQMLVVSDLKELFVPLPDNLLVNLTESRSVIDSFLDNLPDMFIKNPVVSQSCLGPALKAAFTVMKQIGGKMCVFQSIMPNLGDGALKPREKPGIMGTPNEVSLLKPDVTWYKDTALEFSRQQISVDLFLFPYQYMDLAALGELAKYTAGSLHSYVSFNSENDGRRFEERLTKILIQPTSFEAVMRIRCTKGMRITNFYGNFFIRGTDLMALPNVSSDSVYAFDLVHDEQNVTSSHVTVQAALLYTSSDGERRIRVFTQALPVTSLMSDLLASADTDACCALLAKQALDTALKTSLDNARMRLQQICVDIVRAAKSGDKRVVSGYSVPAPPPGGPGAGGQLDDASSSGDKGLPENLKLLPLYTLATMKNVGLRGGTDVHPDERVHAHHLLGSLWIPQSKLYIYPRMFAIHDMDENAGLPAPANYDNTSRVAGRNGILLPPVINLSIDRLTSHGVYLLDNGVDMYLWVGRSADVRVMGSLFGVLSLEDIDPHQMKVLTSGDPLSSRFGAIVQALREDDGDPFVVSPKIYIVPEGDAFLEARFFWFLVEDRASFQGGTHSYAEFMQFVHDPNATAGARGPVMPPAPVRPTGPSLPPHGGVVAPTGPPRSAAPVRGGPPVAVAPPPQQQQQHHHHQQQQPYRAEHPPQPQHSVLPPGANPSHLTPPSAGYGGAPPVGAPPLGALSHQPTHHQQGPPIVGGMGQQPPSRTLNQPAPNPQGASYGAPPLPPAPGPSVSAGGMPPPPGRAVARAPPPPPRVNMPPPPPPPPNMGQ